MHNTLYLQISFINRCYGNLSYPLDVDELCHYAQNDRIIKIKMGMFNILERHSKQAINKNKLHLTGNESIMKSLYFRLNG